MPIPSSAPRVVPGCYPFLLITEWSISDQSCGWSAFFSPTISYGSEERLFSVFHACDDGLLSVCSDLILFGFKIVILCNLRRYSLLYFILDNRGILQISSKYFQTDEGFNSVKTLMLWLSDSEISDKVLLFLFHLRGLRNNIILYDVVNLINFTFTLNS